MRKAITVPLTRPHRQMTGCGSQMSQATAVQKFTLKGTIMNFAQLIAAKRASLAGLTAQRTALGEEGTALLANVEAESRSTLNETEEARHLEIISQRASLQTQIDEAQRGIDAMVADQAADEAATRAAAQRTPVQPVPALRIGEEPVTYRKGGKESYFRDLYMARTYNKRDAVERLSRNDQEQRAISATDTAGGEFVPPAWLLDQFVAKARPGRVLADQLEHQPLPGGTDSINLPRITTGTSVAEQATQNSNVSETDIVTDSVEAKVATLGGRQTVSLQLVEQSPINIDEIVLADLAADHARATDVFCISNNATGKYGVLNVSGLNAVTYTTSTPKVEELLPKIIAAAAAINTSRFLPAEKIFMTPNTWGWIIASQDANKRPLVVPTAFGVQNAAGIVDGNVAQGLAGYITSLSLPVYIDPNIPANLGTGTNESQIIVARTSDVTLYEGAVKAEAFRETKAEQLSVVFRLYNYLALMSARAPKAIAKIAGTGTIVPAL